MPVLVMLLVLMAVKVVRAILVPFILIVKLMPVRLSSIKYQLLRVMADLTRVVLL